MWTDKLKEEGIQPVFSSIRHPQGNIVERIHRKLSRFFRTLTNGRHNSWWNWVKIIEDCINETHHEITEFTPVELYLKKKPKRVWEKWLNLPLIPEDLDYERKLELAYDNICKKGKKRADKFNISHKLSEFKVGDQVLLKLLNKSDKENKIIAKFLQVYEGPYEIKKVVKKGTYILWDPKSKIEKGMYHSQDLKKYISRRNNSENSEN
ncbi:uncharacterized protein LOC122505295 [Leptopilina heterotoma]|uniref:uncharacterized protein LOC122505295 n=1 Tax=Leptopilina heterotoma TaxID=63436 RepID=UPI001CA9F92E|nr:uncharacterized protein LOC122505295 [Leptopilina heterotoma]